MSHWLEKDQRQMWVGRRMGFVLGLLVVGLVAVVGRVYYLQAVAKDELLERMAPVDREITYTPRRGSILDRNGTELAVTVRAPSVFARPRRLEDRRVAAAQLAAILERDEADVFARLDPKRSFVWLARQIQPEVARRLKDLDIEGIGFQSEHKRYYPQQDLAGQLLGFVGIDGDGLEGVERAFEDELSGDYTKLQAKRDARGRMMLTAQTPRFESFEGHSVELTIDERIQRVAQDALRAQVDAYDARGGWAVAMDVQTGEVLAMANTPSFDPNNFGEYTSNDWRLRAITDTFEPGSVVKPLVLAAAMQEKTVSLGSKFDCEEGRIKIGRHTIRDSHPHEVLSAAEVVKVSSNICAYKIAQTIGRQKLHEYLKGFGFGARSGLGLRGEQPGLVWPADKWAEVSFANIAFGQGFTATPLQIVNATAAVANGGMLMQPRIIHRVVDRDGEVVHRPKPKLRRRVLAQDVAGRTAKAMALVTREGGTGEQAALADFTVAGKTGTAQKVNPRTRRYDPDMWIASFVGFFPAEQPRIAIGVMIDEPQKNHYGGTVAAPAFKRIAEEAIRVLGILPPDESAQFFAREEVAEATEDDAIETDYDPTSDYIVDPQEIDRERALKARARRTEQGTIMPNLRGLTAREAIAKSRQIGALPAIHGWGKVVAQTPEPGQVWREGDPIELELIPSTRHDLLAAEPARGALHD